MHDPDPALARQVVSRVRSTVISANLVGAIVVFVTFGLLGGGQDFPDERRWELVVLFLAFTALVFPILTILLTRFNRPVIEALRDGRPFVGPPRTMALAAPWLNAGVSMAGWAFGAVLFPVYNALRLESGFAEALALGLSVALGGLATTGLVYLLTERAGRPVLARVFLDAPPERVRGVAVGPRLLLSWGLSAGAPLLMIAAVLLDPEADAEGLRNIGVALVGIGLVVGWAVTRRAARSVAEPLGSVRTAMRQVREGDLNVTVEVNDATEIGLLQAGFNEMVAGLRERERVRDLFGRHVGEDVARHVVERGVEDGGATREATAVVVDVTSSTQMAASHHPREVVTLLNAFFETVVRVTEHEGGLINKFEGDAALCVFGAPTDLADHASRALRAARSLHGEIEALRTRYPDLDAGIGVSTGTVVAGHVGAERRLEYTVIGDPVNEAARLTDEAKQRPGRVLASEAAVRAAGEEAARWHEAAVFDLRGRSEPTTAYEPDF